VGAPKSRQIARKVSALQLSQGIGTKCTFLAVEGLTIVAKMSVDVGGRVYCNEPADA
jgi:hypothetical protein